MDYWIQEPVAVLAVTAVVMVAVTAAVMAAAAMEAVTVVMAVMVVALVVAVPAAVAVLVAVLVAVALVEVVLVEAHPVADPINPIMTPVFGLPQKSVYSLADNYLAIHVSEFVPLSHQRWLDISLVTSPVNWQ